MSTTPQLAELFPSKNREISFITCTPQALECMLSLYLTLHTQMEQSTSQGCIDQPKATRRHSVYIDGKMPSVTKYSFQIYFWCSARAQGRLHNSCAGWIVECLSAAFIFDENLAYQLEISDTKVFYCHRE